MSDRGSFKEQVNLCEQDHSRLMNNSTDKRDIFYG
jgi:hypothetical protein